MEDVVVTAALLETDRVSLWSEDTVASAISRVVVWVDDRVW